MSIALKKTFALAIFCCARQAERSVDFALASQDRWLRLLEYYHAERRRTLRTLVGKLKGVAPLDRTGITRESLERFWPVWLLLRPITALLNRAKRTWRFSAKEARFIGSTLNEFLQTLETVAKPASSYLIDLRMNLAACEGIVERRLVGVPGLEKAARIEHFYQAHHMKPVRMDEIGAAVE